MTRLLAISVLLTACGPTPDLASDTDQPLPVATEGATTTHGYWALSRWPTLVLDETGTCPPEAVDVAMAPFHAAGIPIAYEAGECRPDHWHVEDGRVCLRVDDAGLWEREAAGNAWWEYRPGTDDQITVGGITVMSNCSPQIIAHEIGHVLGLGHNEDPKHPMWAGENGVLDFRGDLESAKVKWANRPRD